MAVPDGVLVLWDVDHTLVDAAGIGVRAFTVAFRQVYGREVERVPPMAGRTDLAITLDVVRAHGLSESPELLEEFRAATEAAFVALDADLRTVGRALPGAAAALRAMGGVAAAQSLLTGNIRLIAEAKLRAFGLDGHLDYDIGAYGWSHPVRACLVDLARAAARERHGAAFDGQRTVLVGDTPGDVEAALATGAGVVGVATGRYTVAALTEAGAHTVLPDLTGTDAVLDAVARVAAQFRSGGHGLT